jgi:hypothetical protein
VLIILCWTIIRSDTVILCFRTLLTSQPFTCWNRKIHAIGTSMEPGQRAAVSIVWSDKSLNCWLTSKPQLDIVKIDNRLGSKNRSWARLSLFENFSSCPNLDDNVTWLTWVLFLKFFWHYIRKDIWKRWLAPLSEDYLTHYYNLNIHTITNNLELIENLAL